MVENHASHGSNRIYQDSFGLGFVEHPPGYIGWWLVLDLVRLKAYRWTFNRFCQLAQAVDQAQLPFGLNLAQTNLCSSHRPR